MKRTERACVITQILTENPNRDFSLGFFADKFGCAKSSISEDLKVVRTAMDAAGIGYVETTSGSKGGVRFVPYINEEEAREGLETIKAQLAQMSPEQLAAMLHSGIHRDQGNRSRHADGEASQRSFSRHQKGSQSIRRIHHLHQLLFRKR